MRGSRYVTIAAIAVAGFALCEGRALAQGIPVFDQAAIAKQIESIVQLESQLEALNTQIGEAQKLYGSLNKLTDMADVASLLNRPEIRKALPEDFAGIEDLLNGSGEGAFGESAARHLDENATYRSDAEDFYARELTRTQQRNAGQITLGEQIYDAATKRIDGIDELRREIGTAGDAKEIADLQARLQAESAFLQTDVLRMQGLQMMQQAQVQVDEQRKAEDWRKRMDTMGAAFE